MGVEAAQDLGLDGGAAELRQLGLLDQDAVEALEADARSSGGVVGGHEAELAPALVVKELRQGLAHGLDPGVLDALDVDHELAQVEQGDGPRAEDLRRGVEIRRAGLAEEVGQVVGGAVGDVGEGVTQLLEDRDAGIVVVEVGPQVAGEALELAQARGAQGRVA